MLQTCDLAIISSTNYYQLINLISETMISVKITPSPLSIIYKKLLMDTLLLKLVPVLEMSRAFDKLWYQGFIFELKSVGISNALIEFIERVS